MPSDDGAPSARLVLLRAQTAPAHLGAQPEQLGGSPRPQQLASARPKVGAPQGSRCCHLQPPGGALRVHGAVRNGAAARARPIAKPQVRCPPRPPTPTPPCPPAPGPSLPRPARSGPQRGRAARQIRAGIYVRVVLRLPGRRVRGVDAPSPAAAAAAGASAVWPEHTNRRLLTPRGCRLPVQSPRRLAAAVQLIAARAALGRGVAVSLVRQSVVAPHRLGRFSPLITADADGAASAALGARVPRPPTRGRAVPREDERVSRMVGRACCGPAEPRCGCRTLVHGVHSPLGGVVCVALAVFV